MAIATGTALAIGALTSAGTSYAASRSAGNASRRAGQIQQQSDNQAFEIERQRDLEQRRQWEADQSFKKAQFDAHEARRAPYRQASAAALGRLGDLLGPGQHAWRSPSNVGRGTLGDLAGKG